MHLKNVTYTKFISQNLSNGWVHSHFQIVSMIFMWQRITLQDIILSFVSTYNNACKTCFLHIENYGDVCVPAELSLESVEFINLQFNLHNLDKDFTNTLYKYAMSVEGKQCAAILVYNKTKQEEVGKYLRRAGKSIVQKFIWNRDESALIEFIQTGLLTDKTLKSTLDSISAQKYANCFSIYSKENRGIGRYDFIQTIKYKQAAYGLFFNGANFGSVVIYIMGKFLLILCAISSGRGLSPIHVEFV